MKKIFAIVISLLFVASVFGVAQTMAGSGCPTCTCVDYFTVSQTTVQVGDTFTASIDIGCLSDPDLENNFIWTTTPGKFSETIGFNDETDVKIENCTVTATFKALRPGTLIITHKGCGDSVTITITPKEYPFASFMKILGFGKKK